MGLSPQLTSLYPQRPTLTVATTILLSLCHLAAQTNLILNCIGPFRLYDEPVVTAYTESGFNCLDICSEPKFIERMEEMYHEKAMKMDSLVVSTGGSNSVLTNLGLMFNSRQWVSLVAPKWIEAYLSLESEKKVVRKFVTFFKSTVLMIGVSY